MIMTGLFSCIVTLVPQDIAWFWDNLGPIVNIPLMALIICITFVITTLQTILCLIPRTTVTSLSAPKDTRCKTHPLCVNPGVPFERFRKHASCACHNKRLRPEYAMTSRSFSRWDKVCRLFHPSFRAGSSFLNLFWDTLYNLLTHLNYTELL